MTTTSDIIDVTPLAAEKLVDALKEQGEEGSLLRVMVMPGGNGGIQYMLGVEKEPAEGDIVIDVSSVKVLVDAESIPLVEGAQIDYIEGLMRSGFVISNPNAQSGGWRRRRRMRRMRRWRWWWLRMRWWRRRRRMRRWRWWWLRMRWWRLRRRLARTRRHLTLPGAAPMLLPLWAGLL